MSIDWLYSCTRSIFCYFSLLPLFFLFSRELGCDFLRVDVVFYDIPAITIDAHVLFSLLKLSCLWWCRWKEQVRQCNSNFKFFFFLRGHGNESCHLIGSQRGPYFPTSAHGHANALSPSTSLPSLPFFHKYIAFFRLGSIFRQRRRSLPQADK